MQVDKFGQAVDQFGMPLNPTYSSQPKPEKKKVGGLKGFLANALPIIGGGVGSVIGTVAGPVGTLAGGAAGSGLGEFLRQKLTGEETNLGTIGREVALGAVPGVFKGAKALKSGAALTKTPEAAAQAQQIAQQTTNAQSMLGRGAIGTTLKGERAVLQQQADDAMRFNDLAKQNIQRLAQERSTQGLPLPGGTTLVQPGKAPSFASEGVELKPVPTVPEIPERFTTPFTGQTATASTDIAENAIKPSLVQKVGQKATISGSGLKVGSGVGDINKLDEQAQFMAQKGFTGTPEQQLRKMSDEMGSLSKQVDEILTSKPIQVSGAKVAQNLNTAYKDPTVFADLDMTAPRVAKIMEANALKVQNITNAKELNDFVKTINKAATQARAKIADPKKGALNPAETAALATKRVVDEQLSQIPEIAPLKKDMAMIFEVNPDVAKASTKGFGVPFVTGVNLKAPAQALKGAQSKIGATAQATAASSSGSGGFRPFVRPTLEQAGTRVASTALLGTPLAGQGEQPEESTPTESVQAEIAAQQMPEQPQVRSRSQQLFEASMGLLQSGDVEGAKVLSAFAQQAADFEKANVATQKPLSAEAARTVSNAQAGLEAIDLMRGQLANDPSVQAKSAVSGTFDPFGLTSRALGTGEYENARQQAIDIIARLRTGAAITKEEEGRFLKMLPEPADNEATIQQKFGLLQRQFERVASRSGTAGTDLQAAAGY